MAVRKNEKSFIFQGYIFILFLYTFAEKDNNSGQKNRNQWQKDTCEKHAHEIKYSLFKNKGVATAPET